MNLNENILKKYCEDLAKKSVPAVNEPEVVIEFLKYIQMQTNIMSVSDAYEISSTMRSFSNWYNNKTIEPKKNVVNHREVYYVDLGAYNLKYEEGFNHPCLIIRSYGSSVLLIPGSSKKYGKSDDLIFDIKAGDGFRDNTGLLLDQVRCVSTTRLISKLNYGKVKPDTFNDIMYKFIEKFLPKHYNDFNQLKTQNQKLERQLEISNEAIKKLQGQLDKTNEKIKFLQTENENFKEQAI